ncbi:Membrane metallo-endopeptidase-like 1 [Apodemus speciosus]|uniref:Membrane metallo-endopeptidase-like 1 n=1 Tax=Apodemus speciosus TaxID=105296 RepID=A0ABQ0EQJ1_APOSI
MVSLCSPGCPGTHSVDQAGLELRNLPASASQSAGITGMCHYHPAGIKVGPDRLTCVGNQTRNTSESSLDSEVWKH